MVGRKGRQERVGEKGNNGGSNGVLALSENGIYSIRNKYTALKKIQSEIIF